MTIDERAEKAVAMKNSGMYNCAQSVTAALADETDLTEEQLCQISAGFCAGMGNMEATCGALIGAGMIAGLKTEGKGNVSIKLFTDEKAFIQRVERTPEAHEKSDELLITICQISI